jgi:hypothetical protein
MNYPYDESPIQPPLLFTPWCKVFSKLDLRKGYHQVPVNPEDVEKMAVITPFGLYGYVRMPFEPFEPFAIFVPRPTTLEI